MTMTDGQGFATGQAAGERAAGAVGLPRHVAIIMDGNGRWATARGLPRVEGHRRGVEALRRTLKACLLYTSDAADE